MLVVGGAGTRLDRAVRRRPGAWRSAPSRSLYVDADRRRAARSPRRSAPQTLAETPKRLGPFPITVDSSADPDGLALALRSTAPDGICTSTAIYFGEQPSLPLLEMYTKGITFRTGRANAREAMPHVLALAAAGAIHPEQVTTRVVRLGRRRRGAARGRLDEARDRALRAS